MSPGRPLGRRQNPGLRRGRRPGRRCPRRRRHRDHESDHLARLHKAEGQVRGITRMVVDDRYCIDLLTPSAP
ncbi:metal-sensing transcriptional repressor [Streptomyces sp. NPDC059455]|uniref:metal-sensing transcriptional repressor n=1 Tax=Streptomyces sp. NPDC059455 TaxID=3346837 RepID=UPI0036A823D4